MRHLLAGLLLLLTVHGRCQDAVVQAILNDLSIDTLLHYVNELTGETPIDVGNGPELIVSRHKNNPGNAVSQAWIEQKFQHLGYTPQVQVFSTTGRNVWAVKPGLLYPDEFVILCAHYDALPAGFLAAPAADDDGSGTAVVLEAARIMAGHDFAYTTVFALWDEEEQGLVGSAYYAGAMASNDAVIRAVVNMDAIAWDGNGDKKARVHTRPIANSLAIADTVVAMLDRYAIDIDLIYTNPGATYSDHASFWNNGFGAVLIIEDFTNDPNPYYHTSNDKVEHFDVPYFEKLARLSISAFATLAVPMNTLQGVVPAGDAPRAAVELYPNPASDDVRVVLDAATAGHVQVTLLDALGREVALVYVGYLPAGKHRIEAPLWELPQGAYTVRVIGPGGAFATARLLRVL